MAPETAGDSINRIRLEFKDYADKPEEPTRSRINRIRLEFKGAM